MESVRADSQDVNLVSIHERLEQVASRIDQMNTSMRNINNRLFGTLPEASLAGSKDNVPEPIQPALASINITVSDVHRLLDTMSGEIGRLENI